MLPGYWDALKCSTPILGTFDFFKFSPFQNILCVLVISWKIVHFPSSSLEYTPALLLFLRGKNRYMTLFFKKKKKSCFSSAKHKLSGLQI